MFNYASGRFVFVFSPDFSPVKLVSVMNAKRAIFAFLMNYPLRVGDETHAAAQFKNRANRFDDSFSLFGRASG